MSHSHKNIWAVLPLLLTVLSAAPVQLQLQSVARFPASASEDNAHISPHMLALMDRKKQAQEDFEKTNEQIENERLAKAKEEFVRFERNQQNEIAEEEARAKNKEEFIQFERKQQNEIAEEEAQAKNKEEFIRFERKQQNEIAEEEAQAKKKKETEVENVKSHKEDVCSHSESSPMSKQLEALIASQSTLMTAMTALTQSFSLLLQKQMLNSQPNPWYSNAPQTAYQYQSPTAAGNWIYLPNGGSLASFGGPSLYPNNLGNQQNFGQSQMPLQTQAQFQQSMQPQQVQQMPQGYNGWTVGPQMNFAGANSPTAPSVGNFGFNLSNSIH